MSGSTQLYRAKSRESRSHKSVDLGRQTEISNTPEPHNAASASTVVKSEPVATEPEACETSSLVGKSRSSIESDVSFCAEEEETYNATHNSLYADVRGLSMLQTVEFWQLWMLLGLLAGIGLMTIK